MQLRTGAWKKVSIISLKLEWGWIGSSTRNGLSTTYKLTTMNSPGLSYHIYIFLEGPLVLNALNFSTLNADILIMVHQVGLIMFLLKMVDYSMSFFDGQVGWTILDHSYFLNFFCGTPPSCLKVFGGWGGVVGWVLAPKITVSAPVPFWVYWGWNWVGIGD